MIYFAIPFFMAIGLMLARKTRGWMLTYWLWSIALVLFAGLRWQTGTDWLPYSIDYSNPGHRVDFEIGYVILVKALSSLAANYTVFLLFTAAVSTSVVFYTTYQFCKDRIVELYVAVIIFYSYYYLGSWFGAERRQYTIALCFLAVIWIRDRRPWLFLLTVIGAALFHVSGLIFLPAYWLFHLSRKATIYTLSVTAVACLAIAIVGFDRLLVMVLTPLHLTFVTTKLIAYASGSGGEAPPTVIALLIGLGKRSVIYLLFWIVFRNQDDATVDGLLKLYAGSLALYVFSMVTLPMLSVLTIYYSIPEIILIPMMLTRFHLNRALVGVGLAIYAFFQVTGFIAHRWDLYVPYFSVFDHTSRTVLY